MADTEHTNDTLTTVRMDAAHRSRKQTEAEIVAWLRGLDEGAEFHDAGWIADMIEAGEHRK